MEKKIHVIIAAFAFLNLPGTQSKSLFHRKQFLHREEIKRNFPTNNIFTKFSLFADDFELFTILRNYFDAQFEGITFNL